MQGLVLCHLPKLASELGGHGSLSHPQTTTICRCQERGQSRARVPLREHPGSHVSPLSWIPPVSRRAARAMLNPEPSSQ